MAPRGTWKIRRLAQDAELPGDPGPDVADPTADPTDPIDANQPVLDPLVSAEMIGRIAFLNALFRGYQNKGLDTVVLGNIKNQVASAQGINVMVGDEISNMLLDAGVNSPGGDNPKDALLPENMDVVFNQLKSQYGEGDPDMSSKIDQAITLAKQFALNQNGSGNVVKEDFRSRAAKEVQKLRGGRVASKTAQAPDPMSFEPFQSLNEMKSRLLGDGRPQEGEPPDAAMSRVYEKVLGMVGPEHDDRAKAALKSFYQFGNVADLWALFQELGFAAPIDQEVIGEIMQTNPDLFQKDAAKAGLFLPAPDSGLYTMSEGLTKTASGGVGGAGAGYPSYEFEGSNRMCPKIRNIVNTFICRYHCLDGLKIDDSQVVCGEALWRQVVADKFSREYKNEDGEWVGGYLNKRFEIHRDDGGHPYQLKPGRRASPIHEEAWSHEKRLVEMRKAEGEKRGYGPADRDDLYNFDQHKLLGGPESSTLKAKERDPIAKNASSQNWKRTAAFGPEHPNIGMDPREGQDPSFLLQPGKTLTEADVKELELKGLASANDFDQVIDEAGKTTFRYKGAGSTWSIKAAKSNLDKKFDRCVEHVKDKGGDANPYAVCMVSTGKGEKRKGKKKASFNLRRIAVDNGNPLLDGVDMGPKAKECVVCHKKFALNYAGNCNNVQTDQMGNRKVCGGALREKTDGDIKEETHSVDKPEFSLDIPISTSSKDIEVRYANGVFMASKAGFRAYGESASKAVSKLAALPGEVGVEELGTELKKENLGEEPVAPDQPQPEAPPKTVDSTPTTDKIPMSQAPSPFEANASDSAPPPTPSKIEASAGEPLAEGDDPKEQMEEEEMYDDLIGI